MITVHNLENSQSFRVIWLLEELGVPYEIRQYKRDPETGLAPVDYRGLHPIGTSPTISDGELVLAETNAIIDYILDKHPSATMRPEAGTPERVRYLFWFHAVPGSFTPLLTDSLIFNMMDSKSPFFIRPLVSLITGKVRASFLEPRLERLFAYIEEELGHSEWIAGSNLTAADTLLGHALILSEVRIGFGDRFPRIKAYLKRVRERPAFLSALERSGGFTPFGS
ncbi:Glutathione S-transferase GST-6.0 [Pseudovibrio axinellae]|uniref:glutathione transferase n=1 Tax=Pseudovibrio axinellae TaxID=989403 RepID=A0A165T5Q7_9HYPH|nr:glutathione S-transferase [Pseudovibrio axinellae]KZL05473.1 Glutathione S-transferase GST-6.0 [Pseudovibrio axinellae]SEP97774.1 glutathione S-transferase [Pseudovibrio axinellae]